MDEFLEEVLPFIFVAIASLIGAALKAANKGQKKSSAEPLFTPSQPIAPPEPYPYQPAQPTAAPSVPAESRPSQRITPTVHAHLQPDCDTHDVPGSLGVVSTEGKDPCHEDQLTHERTYDEPAKAASGMTFDWSGENMVKAFVMQEVLTRPNQRHAR